jgi:DNA-binding response OmpR family regulator
MEKRIRILLVDDEPSIVKMVGRRLEMEGYEVLVAMDGEEALQKARAEGPDLIILDLMLPKINGYEVCALLKKDSRYEKIPVIMFSARVQEKDEKMGLDAGATAYIRKPFKSQDLIEQIRSLVPPSLSPPEADSKRGQTPSRDLTPSKKIRPFPV